VGGACKERNFTVMILVKLFASANSFFICCNKTKEYDTNPMKGERMAKINMKTIYEQYKHDVYSYLLSLTHNKSLSEDLTSEVFLGAIKALPAFRGTSSIKTWLFSIARNKWYEHLRKSKKELVSLDFMRFYLLEDTSLEAALITNELADRIYALLEQELAISKDIVFMRVHGYSYYEIAQKHNVSESSARVIHFRTLGRIRAHLLKEGYINESDFL
jgi:RNA polymerase sigma-70 factor, ECF subfamily